MTREVFILGEDELCCALAEKIVHETDFKVKIFQRIVAGGADPFRRRIGALDNVARSVMPVLMLADGDQQACVVRQRNAWLPANASARLELRLAVKEAEAWVLADRDGFAKFAKVNVASLPKEPDSDPDPKRSLLAAVERGKRRDLHEEMLPGRGATSLVGFGYNLWLSDFVKNHWSSEGAAARSPSLARALPRIRELLKS